MKSASASDTFDAVFIRTCEPRGPLGATGIGEGATFSILGAVAHGIANATGMWLKGLPITPEKILRALRQENTVNG